MTLRRIIELGLFATALLAAAMALHAWLASRDEQQRLASTLAQQKQLLEAADTRERTRQSALDNTLAQIEKLKRATQTPEQIVSALPKYLQLPQPITLAPQPLSASAASSQERGTTRPGAGGPSSIGNSATPPGGPGTGSKGATGTPPSRASQGISPGATSGPEGDSPLPKALADPHPSQQQAPASTVAAAPCDSAASCVGQIPAADLKPLYDYVQDCRACQAQLAAAKQNASDDDAKIAALTTQRDAALTAAKGGTFWRRFRRNVEWFAIGAAVGGAATRIPRR
jgi:hypothetical protein